MSYRKPDGLVDAGSAFRCIVHGDRASPKCTDCFYAGRGVGTPCPDCKKRYMPLFLDAYGKVACKDCHTGRTFRDGIPYVKKIEE